MATRRHTPGKATASGASPPRHAPHTRLATAWVGICIAAIALVALIVFVTQNTADVNIAFLWLRGSIPLAVALLIASASGAVVVVILGIARITQLRRLLRRRQQDGPR